MKEFHRDQVAKIHIQDLRLRTYIGINDDEKKNQQDVVINIRIHYHAEKAVSFNDIDEALNYRTITKKVIQGLIHFNVDINGDMNRLDFHGGHLNFM